jgi:hypothetical protein
MPNINEWAKNLEAGIEARSQEQATQDEMFRVRRAFIKDHEPALWEELKAAFKNCCSAVNRIKLVCTESTTDLLIVMRDGGTEMLTVRRDPYTRTVTINSSAVYKPTTITRGDGELAYASSSASVYSCIFIAQECVANFVTSMRN